MLDLLAYDRWLFEQIIVHMNQPWLTQLCEMIVLERNLYYIFAVFLAMLAIQRPRQAWQLIILLLVLLAISETVASELKELIARPRPAHQLGITFNPTYVGMPSAHALNSMAIAIYLSGWFPRWGYIFVGSSIIVGAARVIGNWHFPADVVLGWIIGAMVAGGFGYVENALRQRFLFDRSS